MNIKASSLAELAAAAAKILEFLHDKASQNGYQKALVVGLSGDLGSGKTTFSQQVAKHLGVEEQVTSPTFVIEKIYKTKDIGKFEIFVHVDAYRLDDGKDLNILGFADVVNSKNTLIFIEWPEKVEKALPEDVVSIRFECINETTRAISY